MSLTPLEQAAISYFVGGAANDLNIATRWYPRGDLGLVIEDKFQIALRKFGFKAKAVAKPASTAFLEHMLAKGGWASKDNEYGGCMYQFQHDAFRAELKAMQASDPLLAEANAGGESFWADKFAALTGA